MSITIDGIFKGDDREEMTPLTIVCTEEEYCEIIKQLYLFRVKRYRNTNPKELLDEIISNIERAIKDS